LIYRLTPIKICPIVIIIIVVVVVVVVVPMILFR